MISFNKGILFYHDAAGQGDVHAELGGVTAHLLKICKELVIYRSDAEGDIRKYCHTIKEEQKDYDVLFILGGDGTVHELVNGVLEANLNLPIGILPGGTFNDFTKTLNLPPTPVEAVQVLVEGHVRHIDVMKANDRFVLNFIGMGLIVENSEAVVDEHKSKFGKFSYLFSTLKTVTDPTFFDYELTVDGEKSTGTASMIVVANGKFVGGNRIPLKELIPDDGKMHAFIFKNGGIKIFTEMVKEKTTDNWNSISKNVEHLEGTTMQIHTKREMEVDVDGEIDLKTPVNIEILNKRLRLFAGPDQL
ncbi:diacylglycerol kinase family lipid kinase [Macrococcus hajekii]|uniref:Diacylglycerol kinase family lipid kinase n=1 Tax=Macrococcus hajekii TaxID=198482 RepID=A0A4R6BIM7_9STAP|nr:diacylglycerol kinase family protein [Macrococcus hajekii]TDM01503.1 diacylglycerol kinase family lipid kinase [Macrococcus hajekii]GGB00473.1 putative lipid kinase [Macrococcus hajekii]